METVRFARDNRLLVVYDEYGRRRWLVLIGVVALLAVGFVAYLFFAVRLSAGGLLTIAAGLGATLLLLGLVAWWDLSPRLRLLRELIASGVEVPATMTGVVWDSDPESPWGKSMWVYEFADRRYEVRVVESIQTEVLTEGRALLDPTRPYYALIVRPNGILRGGSHLSAQPRSRALVGALALAGSAVPGFVGVFIGLASM